MIAWLLDTAPDGAFDVAWEQVPTSLRVVHRLWWQRRYERAFGSLAAGGRRSVADLTPAAGLEALAA
jgi:hypothetical protein